jgi:hypothetical protein
VPLTCLLYIIYTHEHTLSIIKPTIVVAAIKLIALTWGIVKFNKLRFCWPCLPCTLRHGRRVFMRTLFAYAYEQHSPMCRLVRECATLLDADTRPSGHDPGQHVSWCGHFTRTHTPHARVSSLRFSFLCIRQLSLTRADCAECARVILIIYRSATDNHQKYAPKID